jgi:hypothetical protein
MTYRSYILLLKGVQLSQTVILFIFDSKHVQYQGGVAGSLDGPVVRSTGLLKFKRSVAGSGKETERFSAEIHSGLCSDHQSFVKMDLSTNRR